jgi:hypothetical protein
LPTQRGRRADLAVEIQHRRGTYDSLIGHLDSIPEPDHPNRVIQVRNTRIDHHIIEPDRLYRMVSAHWRGMSILLKQMTSIQAAMKSRGLQSLSLLLSSGAKGTGP